MTAPTFEQTYVKYPFAPLVTLGVKLAAYFMSRKRHNDSSHKDTHIDLGKGMAPSA